MATRAIGNPRCGQGCSEYFVWFCRVWGIVTALTLWGIGIEVAYDTEIIGYYVICAAVVTSCLETVFLVNMLVMECYKEIGRSCKSCWSLFLLFDDWKKGILYILMSIFCLIHNFVLSGEAWLAIIAGIMLVLAGLFYVIKTTTNSQLSLPEEDIQPQNTYNRFGRTTAGNEDLGSGSINNDVPTQLADTVSIQSSTALLTDGLDEQAEIMEA